jgi:predicted esterase
VHGTVLLRPPEDGAGPPPLLVGFHGYGETAERHLAELERLPGAAAWALCAVQALHPFYTRGGDVVAGWMTRFARERAIEDNLAYVAAAVERARRELAGAAGHPEARRAEGSQRLAFIGFSQGVAMAYRAAADCVRRGVACHGLVALAGDVPPELTERDLAGFPPVLIGRGSREDWYSEEKLADDRELLAAKGIEVELAPFEGGHEWTDPFRLAAGEFLGKVLAPINKGRP